jgi:hypothetical protein
MIGGLMAGALALFAAAGRADEPAATPEAAAPQAEAPEVAVTDPNRDPFAPVGYQPAGARSTTAEDQPSGTLQISNMSPEQQARLRAKLLVSGIMRTGASFVALVNDSLVGPGDILEVDFEGQLLKLLVQDIDRDTIKLEPAPE